MQPAAEDDAERAKRREAATMDKLFAIAAGRQRDYQARSAGPSRLVVETARTMARHMGISEAGMRALIPEMAFWQLFLAAAMGADPAIFREVRQRAPWTFRLVREALAPLESHRQVVVAAFHMAGFPLVGAMVGAAWRDLHGGSPHVLVAKRNLSWLSGEGGRWVCDAADVLTTDLEGLRRLMAGLRTGAIKRLLILVDGPHPPDLPGTCALRGLSPALGFKTTLLARILEMGIPILPISHYWEANHLELQAHPLLHPADGIQTVAALLECLLRDHPDQWLNWAAASLRT